MEAAMFYILVACALASVMAYCLGKRIANSFMRRKRLLSSGGDDANLEGWIRHRIRNGFPSLARLVNWLLRYKKVRQFASELVFISTRFRCLTTKESILSVFIAGLLACFCVAFLITRNVAGALAVSFCMVVLAVVYASSVRDRQTEALREEVPAILEIMSACFSSGFTPFQTFKQVSDEVPGELGALFSRAAHRLETGGTVEEALQELRSEERLPELSFVVAALDVQHQSGGGLKQVLATASESVKGELGLKRSLRVQTAQAKLSARIVMVMPFVLVAIFSLLTPDFLSPFFSSFAGYGLLGLALTMQALGVFLVNRALNVQGLG